MTNFCQKVNRNLLPDVTDQATICPRQPEIKPVRDFSRQVAPFGNGEIEDSSAPEPLDRLRGMSGKSPSADRK